MLRLAPPLAVALLAGSVLIGLAGTLLPAFGYLPALGQLNFSLQAFVDLSAVPGIWASAWLSLKSALVVTAVSLVIVAIAFAAWSETRAFAALRHLVSPLLSIPHSAAALGFAFLIAPSGWIVRAFSPELTGWDRPPDLLIVGDTAGLSMMAGLVIKEVPFLFLVTLAALPQTNAHGLAKVAQNIGYGRMASWIYGVWPSLYRQIRLPVFAVLAYASSVVDVALILGPTNPPPLSVKLLQWMSDADLSRRVLAASGAVLQLGVTISGLLIWLGLERIAGWLMRYFATMGYPVRSDKVLRWGSASLVLGCALAVALGLFGLTLWSFAGPWRFPDMWPQSLTLMQWERRLPQIGTLLLTTSFIAALSAFLSLVLTLSCLEREERAHSAPPAAFGLAMGLLYLPLLVPQVAFLMGLQTFSSYMGLSGNILGVVFIHLIFVMPYVYLALGDAWRAFDPRYLAVSASLGKSPARTFWAIRVPMLLPAILTAFAVGFVVSVGQYLPTVLIGAGRVETITSEAVALSSGGNRRVIGIYALLQMVLPFIVFSLAQVLPRLLVKNYGYSR